MSRKTKAVAKAAEAAPPQSPPQWLDGRVAGGITPEEVETVIGGLHKVLIGRAMGGELSRHPFCLRGATKPKRLSNHRGGASGTSVPIDDGPLHMDVPGGRGRQASWIGLK
ncbi:MAG: hypothetical protein HYZ17_13330 [Betaproteobacteria bacterium]|nr:hypothetical protein [Betaproteobacteria bacterium]